MIKRISLLRRLPHLTREEFVAHWSGPHVEIVRGLPGLLGLRLNVVDSWSPEEDGWDGVGELWFESRAAAERSFATEPFASRLRADRALFAREIQIAFVEERTVLAPPMG